MEVTCRASGSPIPTITWSRDGEVIRDSGRARVLSNGMLRVTEVQETETYTCTASNDSGEDRETITLEPTGKHLQPCQCALSPNYEVVVNVVAPRLDRPPAVEPDKPVPDSDVTYLAGQTVYASKGKRFTVDVSYSGSPRPGIVWRLPSGRRLRTGERYGRYRVLNSGSLQVDDAQPRDSGSYRAIAVSRAGQDVIDTPVRVLGK